MTIVVEGDRREVEQITKNVHKLIEVLKVSDLTYDDMVARELALIKVTADSHNRSEIMQIVDIFRAKIVDVSERSVDRGSDGRRGQSRRDDPDAAPPWHQGVGRTGKIAMVRGSKPEPSLRHITSRAEGAGALRIRRAGRRDAFALRKLRGPFSDRIGVASWRSARSATFLARSH